MKKKSLIVTTICLIALAACSQVEETGLSANIITESTEEPTPTLIPGLATSTLQRPLVATPEAEEIVSSATPARTPSPTATPALLPEERLELAQKLLEFEDYESAVDQFQASIRAGELSAEQRHSALLGLGQAQLALDNESAAQDAFSEFLASAAEHELDPDPEENSKGLIEFSTTAIGYYGLADSFLRKGDCKNAINAFERFHEQDDDLDAYIYQSIAECQLLDGDSAGAIKSLQVALEGGAVPSIDVVLRQRLALLYRQQGNFPAALELYAEIYDGDYSDEIKAAALYQAGSIYLTLAEYETGWALFEETVENYPTSYDSYLALQDLIEAGRLVNAYSKGVVEFHGKVYDSAITTLNSYVTNDNPHIEYAHIYLAWSYEGLGNLDAALAQIDAYIEATSDAEGNQIDESIREQEDADLKSYDSQIGNGWIERAELLVRFGQDLQAVESYIRYLENNPQGEDGPYAAWWAAAITESSGDPETAAEYYLNLAEIFPEHEDAPEALYRAGKIYEERLDNSEMAASIWQDAVETYRATRYGARALLRLISTLESGERNTLIEENPPVLIEDYYGIRATHIVSAIEPFDKPKSLTFDIRSGYEEEAENWLRALLELGSEQEVGNLGPELQDNGRLNRGFKLWHIGRKEEAKRELESLRLDYKDDPLASYQLALFLRDLGLYRSSILAARSVLDEAGVDVFNAPKYFGMLIYPAYYAELVLEKSEKYDLDPLLLFALIRQESLFESFATSSAVAQGLGQVIPDTGQYIANLLNWPNYVNEDLYKPYVSVEFSSFYLAEQLERFDGDVAVALSAYNGGPGNAARWAAQTVGGIDQYIEVVDFNETRQYIERIYAGHSIYKYLYDG